MKAGGAAFVFLFVCSTATLSITATTRRRVFCLLKEEINELQKTVLDL